jgi:hypothetical protein
MKSEGKTFPDEALPLAVPSPASRGGEGTAGASALRASFLTKNIPGLV